MTMNRPSASGFSRRIGETGDIPSFSLRLAEIAALRPDGSLVWGPRRVPALPVFDAAFGAFAQGTVFKAREGHVAVEDLQPGDWLRTATGGVEQVTWIGSAVFVPEEWSQRLSLTRIAPESFGFQKPESTLCLGPAARILKPAPDGQGDAHAGRTMTAPTVFLDGESVIPTQPPTPVRLFHVATRQHAALIAGGLPVESYHPGAAPLASITQPLHAPFLGLFPQIGRLADFGPMRFVRAQEPVGTAA